jgi:hypothetical protein
VGDTGGIKAYFGKRIGSLLTKALTLESLYLLLMIFFKSIPISLSNKTTLLVTPRSSRSLYFKELEYVLLNGLQTLPI